MAARALVNPDLFHILTKTRLTIAPDCQTYLQKEGAALFDRVFGRAAASHVLCAGHGALVRGHVFGVLAQTRCGWRGPAAFTAMGDDGLGRGGVSYQGPCAQALRGCVGSDCGNVPAFGAGHRRGTAGGGDGAGGIVIVLDQAFRAFDLGLN